MYAGIKAAAMNKVSIMRTRVFLLFSFLNIAILFFLAIFPINLPVIPAERARMTRLIMAYGKNDMIIGVKDAGEGVVGEPDAGRNDEEPRKVDRTAAILPMRGSAIIVEMFVPEGTGDTEKGEVPEVLPEDMKFPESNPMVESIAKSAEAAKPHRDIYTVIVAAMALEPFLELIPITAPIMTMPTITMGHFRGLARSRNKIVNMNMIGGPYSGINQFRRGL